MPRARNPKREEARKIWKGSKGKKKLKDIAKELGISEAQIRNWKNIDRWEKRNVTEGNEKDNVTLQEKEKKSRKEQKNRSGNPNPVASFTKGNSPDCSTHGFYKKIFPPEALELATEIITKTEAEILWDNIVIQYTAIARAQKLMHVTDQSDLTKEGKRARKSANSSEVEYELQFAWDKQANFMNAQSRAMATLSGMIEKYKKLVSGDEMQMAKVDEILSRLEVR